MYTNFLTFMPAEIRKYLAVGIDSSVGSTVHLEDPISGKKLYYKYDDKIKLTRKVVAGENGISENGIDTTTGEALEPVLEWKANPIEGLAVSTAKTIHDVATGDIQHIRENPQQWENTKLFLFNLLFAAIVSAIIAAIMENFSDLKKNATVATTVDLFDRTARELNIYESLIKPVDQFGIIGTDFIQKTF